MTPARRAACPPVFLGDHGNPLDQALASPGSIDTYCSPGISGPPEPMFDVHPSQVEALDATELVLLLRRLLHAEARAAGLPLAAVGVPLQITVKDGGEDGRISWEGGHASTDYLPGRENFFQCKASKVGRAGWKKECWAKSSHGKGKPRVLSLALSALLEKGGCYVGFTTEALIGLKRDDYVAGIKEAIAEAGGDWARLEAIKVYDANMIGAWAAHHPSVAIWLAELSHRQSLAGYQTVESWGRRPDFDAESYIGDTANRFTIGSAKAQDDSGADNSTTAKVAWARIVEHVAEPGSMVRLVGTSGLGKSRFVYESLRASTLPLAAIVQHGTVFADYNVVATNLLSVASFLAESGKRALLVVDECPRDVAVELGKLARRSGSWLSVITIDTDDRSVDEEWSLHVVLSLADANLIDAIILRQNSGLDPRTVERLRQICGGYPRFAVLAAGSAQQATIFETADDVIDRILRGAGIAGDDEMRALQSLCLFESVSVETTSPVELDLVASVLARMSGDAMYEHLTKAQSSSIVGRQGDRMSVQPLPVAVRLAMRRTAVMRPSLLVRFIKSAPQELALSLLRRWRHLDKSQVVVEAARGLLAIDDQVGTTAAMLTPHGSAMLDALVHVIPDRVATHLDLMLGPLGGEELRSAQGARRGLVEALTKLVFRSRSFATAARLLMRLGAAENESYANNASNVFKQLFHVQLSGTEVAPDDRFAILDEGLESGDPDILALCLEALGNVFSIEFVRFGDTGSIGSGPALVDWHPKTWDEVNEFYRDGLTRLVQQRSARKEMADRCEAILARAARAMLSTDLCREYGTVLAEISDEKGGWPEAIEGVGDWLYFDRSGAPTERAEFVRELYTRLFPADPVGRAIVFTRFWQADIRDPDAVYRSHDNDFDYSNREARRIASEIAKDASLTLEAVRRMTPMDLKTIHPFAEELARLAKNRAVAFHTALAIVAEGGSLSMLRGLLRGIDLVDRGLANACLVKATDVLAGKQPLIDLYSTLSIDRQRLADVIRELETGRIVAADCVYLSYGRGLDELEPGDVARLLHALSKLGSDGTWAALEVAHMYRYGAAMPRRHAKEVATLLQSPLAIGHAPRRHRQGHILEGLVDRVRGVIGIGDKLALGLAQQVIGLAQSPDFNFIDQLAGAMRHIISILVAEKPRILWSQVERFYETATPIERSRLKRMIGPDPDRFDRSKHTQAGPLFGVPEKALFQWADAAPDRAGLLLDFYPTLVDVDGATEWHPALTRLAERYGSSNSFTQALERRINPSSWSGSIVPLLKVYLAPLERWRDHRVRPLRRWAKKTHGDVEERIRRAKDYESDFE